MPEQLNVYKCVCVMHVRVCVWEENYTKRAREAFVVKSAINCSAPISNQNRNRFNELHKIAQIDAHLSCAHY